MKLKVERATPCHVSKLLSVRGAPRRENDDFQRLPLGGDTISAYRRGARLVTLDSIRHPGNSF